MRIASFWAKGFRSLRDVHLPDLGTFNVFYGPNGSGKSNILAAIRVLRHTLRREPHLHQLGESCGDLTRAVLGDGVIQEHDLYARDDTRRIVLGARFTSCQPGSQLLGSGPLRLEDLTVEYTFDWVIRSDPKIVLTRLESDGRDVRASLAPEQGPYLVAFLRETLPVQAYTLIEADRFALKEEAPTPRPSATEDAIITRPGSWIPTPKPSRTKDSIPIGDTEEDIISWHVRNRRLARALFIANNSPSRAGFQRLVALRSFLEGPPLGRKRFRPVQDPRTQAIQILELLPEPNPENREIPLDLAGLGIAQIYMIIAQAVLSGAHAVGIEEPEAHLYAPKSGQDLAALLKRLVDEKYIDQLFIATHHHQFALAETYFDVSLDASGATQVTPRPRDEAVKHFYEPSPYWDTLRKLVGEGMSPDTILLLDREGQPIRAKDVLDSIEGDRRIADQFVEAATKAFVLSLAKDEPEK